MGSTRKVSNVCRAVPGTELTFSKWDSSHCVFPAESVISPQCYFFVVAIFVSGDVSWAPSFFSLFTYSGLHVDSFCV